MCGNILEKYYKFVDVIFFIV